MTVHKKRATHKKRAHHPMHTVHKRRKRVGAMPIIKRIKPKTDHQKNMLLVLAGAAVGGFAIPKLIDMLPENFKQYGDYLPLAGGAALAFLAKKEDIKMLGLGLAASGVNPVLRNLKVISGAESMAYVNASPDMFINAIPMSVQNQINDMAMSEGLYTPSEGKPRLTSMNY